MMIERKTRQILCGVIWGVQLAAELAMGIQIYRLGMLPDKFWIPLVLLLAALAALTGGLLLATSRKSREGEGGSRRGKARLGLRVATVVIALATAAASLWGAFAATRLLSAMEQVAGVQASQLEEPDEEEGSPEETTAPPTVAPTEEPTEAPEETAPVEVEEDITNTPFLLYLSGSDTRDETLSTSRSDVNILAVVNPTTKQVLLINTPRDYYIANPAGDGELDKLTHCGIYGMDCSIGALSELYEEEVDYYAQINFTGFKKLIDAIGGITVESEVAFTTYNDYKIQAGENQLDGAAALAFARERYALSDGDNGRGQNQMRIIKAVIQKLCSGTILTKYGDIMDSLEGMFVTDMSGEEIAKLVKMQLSDGAEWNVQSYAVTGTGGRAVTYSMPGQSVYVTYPDEDSVEWGKELIHRVTSGEILTAEDVA